MLKDLPDGKNPDDDLEKSEDGGEVFIALRDKDKPERSDALVADAGNENEHWDEYVSVKPGMGFDPGVYHGGIGLQVHDFKFGPAVDCPAFVGFVGVDGLRLAVAFVGQAGGLYVFLGQVIINCPGAVEGEFQVIGVVSLAVGMPANFDADGGVLFHKEG